MFAATTRMSVAEARPISMIPTEGTYGFFRCGEGIFSSKGKCFSLKIPVFCRESNGAHGVYYMA